MKAEFRLQFLAMESFAELIFICIFWNYELGEEVEDFTKLSGGWAQ